MHTPSPISKILIPKFFLFLLVLILRLELPINTFLARLVAEGDLGGVNLTRRRLRNTIEPEQCSRKRYVALLRSSGNCKRESVVFDLVGFF